MRFPDLAAAIASLRVHTLVLDGEVAIFDAQLRSRFELLRRRDPGVVATPPLLMAFDVLYRDGADVTARPLRARCIILEDLVAGADRIFAVRRLAANGLKAWAQVVDAGFEGYVAKDEASPYRGRQHRLGHDYPPISKVLPTSGNGRAPDPAEFVRHRAVIPTNPLAIRARPFLAQPAEGPIALRGASMRVIAGILVAIGLATALVGEVAIFLQHDRLEREVATSEDIGTIRHAQQALSMWPAMALGASITAVGFLLDALGRRADQRRSDAKDSRSDAEDSDAELNAS